jgi:putative redox protein
MQLKIKPKTYGPLLVRSNDEATLEFETEAGHRAQGALTPSADGMSPSDLMLAALGNCIAISLRMAARQMALEVGTLEVSAIAIKATDLPNRFGRFEVTVRSGLAVDATRADELLRRTKDICTVSNTLGADVALHLNP